MLYRNNILPKQSTPPLIPFQHQFNEATHVSVPPTMARVLRILLPPPSVENTTRQLVVQILLSPRKRDVSVRILGISIVPELRLMAGVQAKEVIFANKRDVHIYHILVLSPCNHLKDSYGSPFHPLCGKAYRVSIETFTYVSGCRNFGAAETCATIQR